MKKLISIIIPTYNMEQYLEYCLNSLLISKNFELLDIIVVNDGSKDKSLEIARRFEAQYPGVFRIIDKPNGNYGSCINAALQLAEGKYVKVLDADDSFDKDNFEDYVEWLQAIDADLVLSDFAVVDENRTIKKIIKYGFPVGIELSSDEICRTGEFKSMQMHAVTYNRENLLKIGYYQVEGVSYTDQQWIFTPMITVKRVYNYDKPIYKYLIGRVGQTMDPAIRNKQITHNIACVKGMLDDYNRLRENISSSMLEYLHCRLIWMIKDTYIKLLSDYNSKTKERAVKFDEMLLERSQEIYDLVGSREVSSFKGFEYLTYWRTHKNINTSIIRILCKSYVCLMEIKNSMRKPGKMSMPTI